MGMRLKIYLRCADRFINMLVATSDAAPQAMLVPEMNTRIAETLNYFLRHLTGPDRSKLSVSNPGKVRYPSGCVLLGCVSNTGCL
jgi:Ubiquitin elongating factor core